jgi:hypothetical protein
MSLIFADSVPGSVHNKDAFRYKCKNKYDLSTNYKKIDKCATYC